MTQMKRLQRCKHDWNLRCNKISQAITKIPRAFKILPNYICFHLLKTFTANLQVKYWQELNFRRKHWQILTFSNPKNTLTCILNKKIDKNWHRLSHVKLQNFLEYFFRVSVFTFCWGSVVAQRKPLRRTHPVKVFSLPPSHVILSV